jgi:hypothetical protein
MFSLLAFDNKTYQILDKIILDVISHFRDHLDHCIFSSIFNY